MANPIQRADGGDDAVNTAPAARPVRLQFSLSSFFVAITLLGTSFGLMRSFPGATIFVWVFLVLLLFPAQLHYLAMKQALSPLPLHGFGTKARMFLASCGFVAYLWTMSFGIFVIVGCCLGFAMVVLDLGFAAAAGGQPFHNPFESFALVTVCAAGLAAVVFLWGFRLHWPTS